MTLKRNLTNLILGFSSSYLAACNLDSNTRVAEASTVLDNLEEEVCEASKPVPLFGGIIAWPNSDIGRRVELMGLFSNFNSGVEIDKIILYEDGEEIARIHKSEYIVEVTKNTFGVHRYRAEAIDEFGNSAFSKEIEISFSGKVHDRAPYFSGAPYDLWEEVGIGVVCIDSWDNRGIVEVELYQDNNSVAKFDGIRGSAFMKVIDWSNIKNAKGAHDYQIRCKDMGANQSWSGIIEIAYYGNEKEQ